MAKTAKLKKRQSTIHSRAARRAVSPSVDLDKSITKPARVDPPPPTSNRKPHVFSAQNAGISKRSKSKPMKRQQRLRQLNAIERAADNMDKLELKVQKSAGKEKKVRDRKKGWEELNVHGGNEKSVKMKRGNVFNGLEDGEEESRSGKEREWVSDEEMDPVEGNRQEGNVGFGDVVMVPEQGGVALGPEISGEVKQVVLPESVPLPVATLEEDEML